MAIDVCDLSDEEKKELKEKIVEFIETMDTEDLDLESLLEAIGLEVEDLLMRDKTNYQKGD